MMGTPLQNFPYGARKPVNSFHRTVASVLIRVVVFFNLFAPPIMAKDASAEALIEGGHWKRARALLEQRVNANPNDAQAVCLLSRVKIAFGDFDAALSLAEKAVALNGRNADYHYQLAEVYSDMLPRAGTLKQLSLSLRKELDAALALDPKHLDALSGLMQFYLEAPWIAGGDKGKARAIAEQMVRIDAARGYLAMARLAQAEKDLAKVEGFYLKALQANPRNYEVQLALANLYGSQSKKKYDLAVKHAREALALDAGREVAYSILAVIFAMGQRWGELDAILAQAEKNVPDNLNPHYQAGRVLAAEGKDLPRAERYFRKYLTWEPEGYRPDFASAHWRLGLTLEKQGRKSEALSELEIAVRMKPDFDIAKKDLRRLK